MFFFISNVLNINICKKYKNFNIKKSESNIIFLWTYKIIIKNTNKLNVNIYNNKKNRSI